MVCLGLEPAAAGWQTQTNPLSYGCTQEAHLFYKRFSSRKFYLCFTIADYDCRVALTRK